MCLSTLVTYLILILLFSFEPLLSPPLMILIFSQLLQSQCSSQEKLAQQQLLMIHGHLDETTLGRSHMMGSCSHHSHPHHPLAHHSVHQRLINSSSHFGSNDSNPSIMSVEEEGSIGSRSPRMRPRSRSLSSPCRSPLGMLHF